MLCKNAIASAFFHFEVKAEVNRKAKSLKTYHQKFAPHVSVRTSMADFKKEDWLINLPLYAIESLVEAAGKSG